MQVHDSKVYDSTRLGVVVIQQIHESDNSGHTIQNVEVRNFGVDGIQIQGDRTTVEGCTVGSDTAAVYGIHVCSPDLFDSTGMQAICVPPGEPSAQLQLHVVHLLHHDRHTGTCSLRIQP